MIKFIHLPSHSNVPLSKCFSASYLRVPCSRFLLRRGKTRIFTLTELLMRKSCKSGISFRQQGRAGHCQSPDLTSSFFIPLLNCSIVQMFPRSFLLQSSLFLCSYFEGENKDFHPYRASHRDCDHRHSCLNASAGVEQGKRNSQENVLHQ